MRRAAAVVMVALLSTATASAEGTGMQDEAVKPPSSFEIPFEGPGQLAAIWSWARIGSDGNQALVVASHGESRRIAVEAPTRVRWRSPTELIVEQTVWPVRDGSATRVLRMSRQGEILDVLHDRDGLGGAQPSPNGDWALFDRIDKRGFRGLEVRSLADDFRLLTVHPKPTGAGTGSMTGPVWSPDGSQFSVGLNVPNPPLEPGRLYPRLAIASRQTPGFTRVDDGLPDGTPERWAVVPEFWSPLGIYARSRIGLLRCDPKGAGCASVYAPGEHRAIVSGTQVGNQKALLLVRDLSLDPLETRAKEIHEVDLTTGRGRVLLRLPDDVFLSDLDWVGDPGS